MLNFNLNDLILQQLYGYSIVFMRVGAMFMLIPGIAEVYVPPRIRLAIALLLTFVITPLVSQGAGLPPQQPLQIFFDMGQEIAIGLFLGFLCRILLLSLETAGSIIAFQSSLSNAMAMNVQTGEQSALPGTFLTAVGAMMIFATSMHHVMITALVESYHFFHIKSLMTVVPSMPETVVHMVGQSFALAMKISSPFLVIGTVFFLVLGLLNRLMPQMMIFFVAQPAQLALGFILFMVTLTMAFQLFNQRMDAHLHDVLFMSIPAR
jgi:flagellar biosynthetic protein FliR